MELQTMQQQSNNGGGMLQVAQSRQAQEVQAAMVIAQRFPRDTNRAFSRIIEDCKRKTLAERSVYSYPRGSTTVTGPSIRLAECLARSWGNLDFGIIELERKPSMGSLPGESTIMAYCYDLETNTKSSTVFTVRHSRDKTINVGGQRKKIQELLTDERDIYEMVANLGARRLRSRILAIIPVDIIESAVAQCEKTMEGGQGPLIDRVRACLVAFQPYAVTQEMIEKRLNHKIEAVSETELVSLKTIWNSLKDGAATREDFFELPQTEEAKAESETEEKPKAEKKAKGPRSVKDFTRPAPQQEVVEEVAPKVDEKQERDAAIKAVLTAQKKINMSTKDLASFVEMHFSKKTTDLTTDELHTLHEELLGMAQ